MFSIESIDIIYLPANLIVRLYKCPHFYPGFFKHFLWLEVSSN